VQVGLIGQARLPEVHLVVDHPGQQVLAGGVNDHVGGQVCKARADPFDETVLHQHVGGNVRPSLTRVAFRRRMLLGMGLGEWVMVGVPGNKGLGYWYRVLLWGTGILVRTE
jgi:hypothetical protein